MIDPAKFTWDEWRELCVAHGEDVGNALARKRSGSYTFSKWERSDYIAAQDAFNEMARLHPACPLDMMRGYHI